MPDPAVDLSPERFAAGVPYDDLARLRATAPAWWSEALGAWVVTSYELVERCNRDWATFSSAGGVVDPTDAGVPEWRPITGLDPPEHSRARRAVMPPFTPGPVGRLEGLVREIARAAVASLVSAGGGDFVASVAAAVPFRVMAALTGVPAADEATVVGWTNAVMPSADPDYRPSPGVAERSRRDLGDYCLALARSQRRGEPAFLARALFAADIDGRPLTDAEVANFLDTFIVGGTETTRQLLSHGLLALMAHPDQRDTLVADPAGVPAAVEEMLRWASPVLHHSRWATAETSVGGATVSAGDRVTLWIASANRDEAVFSDPDAFDARRDPNPHVSLGAGGPHHCMGAHLARLEARVVFEELRSVLGRLRADGPAVRVPSNFFNGVKRLPVAVG